MQVLRFKLARRAVLTSVTGNESEQGGAAFKLWCLLLKDVVYLVVATVTRLRFAVCT